MRLGDAAEHGSPARGVATVVGRGRSAAAVADEPRVVECDFAGMTAEGRAIPGAFRLVSNYLVSGPGPVVMVHAPDSALRAGLRSVASSAHSPLLGGGRRAPRTEPSMCTSPTY